MSLTPVESVNFVNLERGAPARPLPFARAPRRGASLSGSFGWPLFVFGTTAGGASVMVTASAIGQQ